MSVDKDKLFQEYFAVCKKSNCGQAPGKVQKMCVDEWRKISQRWPEKKDDKCFEEEVKVLMAREQAKIRSGSMMKYLLKVGSVETNRA